MEDPVTSHLCSGAGDPGGLGGPAPPPPRIQDLCSKFFENCQNLIFPIIRAPLSKNCSPAPAFLGYIFFRILSQMHYRIVIVKNNIFMHYHHSFTFIQSIGYRCLKCARVVHQNCAGSLPSCGRDPPALPPRPSLMQMPSVIRNGGDSLDESRDSADESNFRTSRLDRQGSDTSNTSLVLPTIPNLLPPTSNTLARYYIVVGRRKKNQSH